ncbi:MAG: hypothetical protein JXR96_25190 [Deltaproteobacteria bacterium]|nr:hypothetical protein [Deltaproteobacteria bacterium]
MRCSLFHFVLAAALSSLALWPRPARSGIEETFGLSSRGIALGGAYTSLVCDTSAAYYNPAGLNGFPHWRRGGADGEGLEAAGFSLDLGTLYGASALSRRIDGVQKDGGAPTAAGGVYGLSLDLERLLGVPYTALGMIAYMPYDVLFEYESQSITNPIWIRHFDGYNHLSLYPAIAFSPSKYISVGIGLRFSLQIETHTNARYWYEDDCQQPPEESWRCAHVDMGEEVTTGSHFSYLVGIMARPIENLKLAAVFREGSDVYDWGDTRITNIPLFLFEISYEYDHLLSHYYHPTQYEFGASWEDDFWMAALTASYNEWDDFIDAYRELAVPTLQNTVTLRAGGGIRVHPSTTLLLGYAYEPSPVPAQTMISNFLDCDRHILSLGSSVWVDELFGFASPRIGLNLHFQLQILPERSHTKDAEAIREFYRERLASVEVLDEDGNAVGSLDPQTQAKLVERYTDKALLRGERFSYSGLFYSFGLTLNLVF